MENYRVPRWLASLIMVLLMLTVAYLVIYVIYDRSQAFYDSMPRLMQRLKQVTAHIQLTAHNIQQSTQTIMPPSQESNLPTVRLQQESPYEQFLLRGMGFTKMQIGTVQKTTAMVAIILGGLLGGWMLMRMSLRKALWICGFVQAGSILGFWAISLLGRHLPLLVAANTLENLAYGMGSSALVALLMGSCNRSYTGTQYALFSALTALPRTLFAGMTGFMADWYGWKLYFPVCALAAIPGLLLLLLWDRWGLPEDSQS